MFFFLIHLTSEVSKQQLQLIKNGIGKIYHKDHLGNTRVAFTDRNENGRVDLLGPASEITQQLDYYPFGLQHQGEGLFHEPGTPVNRIQYNGKEMVAEVGLLDYGARWYDAALGRWSVVDPMVDSYSGYSPYVYTLNNPTVLIDPNGMYASSNPYIGSNSVTDEHRTSKDEILLGRALSKLDIDTEKSSNYPRSSRQNESSIIAAFENAVIGEIYSRAAEWMDNYNVFYARELLELSEQIMQDNTFVGFNRLGVGNNMMYLGKLDFEIAGFKFSAKFHIEALSAQSELNVITGLKTMERVPGYGQYAIPIRGMLNPKRVNYGPPGSTVHYKNPSISWSTIGYASFTKAGADQYDNMVISLRNQILSSFLKNKSGDMKTKTMKRIRYDHGSKFD